VLLAALARAAPGATIRVSYADAAGVDEASEVIRVTVEPPSAGRDADDARDDAPLWDDDGLRLAVELARDHGARLGADPLVPRVRDADRLVAGLTAAPAIYLRLPVSAPSDRPAPDLP
jgi:hypothetical protein